LNFLRKGEVERSDTGEFEIEGLIALTGAI